MATPKPIQEVHSTHRVAMAPGTVLYRLVETCRGALRVDGLLGRMGVRVLRWCVAWGTAAMVVARGTGLRTARL